MDETFIDEETYITLTDDVASIIVESIHGSVWTLKPECHNKFIANLLEVFDTVSYKSGTYITDTIGIKLISHGKKLYAVFILNDDDYSDDESYVASSFFNAAGMRPPSYGYEE